MSGKVLVTGDRGYIGSVLVPLLINRGYDVTGLDTDYYERSVLQGSSVSAAYQSIRKDIRQVEKKDLAGIESIIHLAALSNDPMGNMDESLTVEINYSATMRLAELAKKSGVRRFLFSSSCSIYGKTESGFVDETSATNPLTAYAKSKINVENGLTGLAAPDFFAGILRNSTVYGYSPKFRDDLVVNNLVVTALMTGEIRVMSDGSPWRPLIDVRDLARFFVLFLETHNPEISGKPINVGFNENNFQVKDIVRIIEAHLPGCHVRFTGEHGSDTRSYRVKFDLLHSLLPGVIQEWPLKKSVADLIHHLRTAGIHEVKDNRFTRIHTLQELLKTNAVNAQLYRNEIL